MLFHLVAKETLLNAILDVIKKLNKNDKNTPKLQKFKLKLKGKYKNY